ncbi:PAS domain S-box protein [Mesorhizobium sp. B2-3-14]|uniref:PAS domain S-box protein n=1 Tax=Mesorhizobium sp. B2-3-14 TaxID=2589950 RepID=UPI00112E456A|nr:PAS domain S-box protein [Mesorhizobium sp. B2-3-14]TPL88909.1 PAS domain S-box protein [Mesorhizobium sp. B2-3-14]
MRLRIGGPVLSDRLRQHLVSSAVLLATLFIEMKSSLTGGGSAAFLECVPAIVIIAFLEDRWPAMAATFAMVAVGLAVRLAANGQLVGDDLSGAILLALSGGMIAFLFHRSRQELRSALDVAENRLTAIETTEARYRWAFERAALGFATANDRGELLQVNMCMCSMSGYAQEELVGQHIETLVHPDERDLFARLGRALSAEAPSFGLEMRLRRKDGTVFWARVTLSWSGPEKQLPMGIFVVFEDITERRAASEALLSQKEWLDLALLAGRLGTWRVDYKERIVSGSDQFWEILGLPPAASRPLDELSAIIHTADWPKLGAHSEFIAATANYDAEVRVRRSDGQFRWIALRGREDIRDGYHQRFGIAADLTERRQTTLLRAAVRRQERLILEQRHRLSNLFAVITAVVKMIPASDQDISKYRGDLLERIRALESTHLLLINNAELSSTIRDIVAHALRPYAEAHRATITGPHVRIVGGAAESFAMVVHELTTNSVKHGVLGNSQGQVEVRWGVAPEGSDGDIVFDWIERGGRNAKPVLRKGFGSIVLGADGTPLVGHSSKLEMSAGGLRYQLRLSQGEIQP